MLPPHARMLHTGGAQFRLATLVAILVLPSCGSGELSRTTAKHLIADHIENSTPLSHVDIPISALISTSARLTGSSDSSVALELTVPHGTPPLRLAQDCTAKLLPHGSRFFKSVQPVRQLGGGGHFLRLELLNPIQPEVQEVSGILKYPGSDSICAVEYTWTYPLPSDAARVRCAVTRTGSSAGPSSSHEEFEVVWLHAVVPVRAAKTTISRYDDGWRVTR